MYYVKDHSKNVEVYRKPQGVGASFWEVEEKEPNRFYNMNPEMSHMVIGYSETNENGYVSEFEKINTP